MGVGRLVTLLSWVSALSGLGGGHRLLLWMLVRSQTYYPEHGSRKTCYSLVMGFSSFSIGWRSKHHTEGGPQVLGAWSPSLDGDLDPLIGVEQILFVPGV
jgi:hypothetical protein